MEKMVFKKEKKGPLHGEKGTSKEENSTLHEFFFFQWERSSASTGSPMSEIDNKINNIFRNYSSHNYIEIHSRMHPNALFYKKKFSDKHTL